MTVIETRFRENYPTIFMMMISLIVGLLYENLVGAMQGLDGLWRGDAESFFVWTQCLMLATMPLLFWFTQTLNSAALRAVFVPRSAIVPILAASGLFFFVSNLGGEHAIAWLYVWGAVFALAWVAFRDFGSLYEADADAPGGLDAHRGSSALMVVTGLIVFGGGILVHTGKLGFVGAGAFLWLGVVGGIVAHSLWYREWKVAVGLTEERS